jgi:hypothetical protein
MTLDLCCIIEGHGESQAVPVLVRRIQQDLRPDIQLNVLSPIRVSRHKIVKAHELERAIELAARQSRPPRAILILVDADDDPPCTLGPELLKRAKAARPDVSIGVVLAKSEFETWFLAAIESLSGRRGLPVDLRPIPSVESIRDAKGKLKSLVQGSLVYSPIPDQPALAAIFDMALARTRSDSFNKCWREIERLLAETVGPRKD